MRTVQRTVINMGSQSRRPTRIPLLTARNKALLLFWARQHYHFAVDDWKHVTWSDESRLNCIGRMHVFEHFHWPPKSPEMNVIEDIRDALLHAVENRSPPPRIPMDLWTVLKDEWCELPPRYLQTLVESMPRSVAALLCVRGGPTRY
ncbi:hypothetical protein AVEN_237700-1 [Araneus ventricosus]|uniref:Tc1-like transposase DDE domain-containing protein n=1 Tax=Araneus ventricosus TaxID=182803 RepID=A0A4Y2ERE1_ARAVE|nr:hypothetical protein AVEN_237700-1 [Araneus ventricosus]